MRRRSSFRALGTVAAVALIVAAPIVAARADTLFGERWYLSGEQPPPLKLVPHRPVYVLPLSYNEEARAAAVLPAQDPVGLDRAELVYQLSAKAVLAPDLLGASGDLWLGYTQRGWWQAYNADESQPFRETNYEPELIYAYQPASEVFGIEPQLLTLRLNHLSNGRGPFYSISFNRLGAGLLFDDGEQAFRYQAWYALPSEDGVDEDIIIDYFGRVQVDWFRALGASTLHVSWRNNLSLGENRSSLNLGYSFATPSPYLHGYVEYRYGYNDALVDYDHAANRISIGAMLIPWY